MYFFCFILNFFLIKKNIHFFDYYSNSFFFVKYLFLFFNFSKIRGLFLNYFFIFFKLLVSLKGFVDFFFGLYFKKIFKFSLTSTNLQIYNEKLFKINFFNFVKKLKKLIFFFNCIINSNRLSMHLPQNKILMKFLNSFIEFFYDLRVLFINKIYEKLFIYVNFFFYNYFNNIYLFFYKQFCINKKIAFIFKYFSLLFFKNFKLFFVLLTFLGSNANIKNICYSIIKFKYLQLIFKGNKPAYSLLNFASKRKVNYNFFFFSKILEKKKKTQLTLN